MKNILLAAIIATATIWGAGAQRNTCLPLSQKEADTYLKAHPSASVTVTLYAGFTFLLYFCYDCISEMFA